MRRRRLSLALGLVIAGLVQAGPAPTLQLFPHAPSATNRPNPRCDQPMCVALLRAIDGASTSIDFAIYGLRGQDEVLAALVRAQARGVMVKGVVDADIQGRNYYADTPRLLKALANVRTDQATDRRSLAAQRPSSTRPRCARPADREGPLSCFSATVGGVKYELAQASEDPIEFEGDIMHDKFFVIDRQAVWTGSANVSDSDVGGYNANVAVLITQPDVAAAYSQEFEQLYQGRFHREKKAGVARQIALPGGGTAQVLFSPQDGAMKEVVQTLKAARRNINISVFYLTSKDVATALLEARQRGVKVRLILDATAAQNEYTKHELLRSAGAQVKVENWGGKMHAKAASVDGRHLILGSMNWTAAGDLRNDENTLILRDVPVHVRTYDAAFDVMWRSIPDAWLKANPRPEGTESGRACQDGIDNDYDGQADSKDADCRSQPAPTSRAAPRGLDCPPGFPVKGNAGSMIFHVPGGGFYNKTRGPRTASAAP
ncbi:phospholipase D-like domain-containing protein [Deinococcus arenicola]|uniref:phospholipase D n=1 Tax=Deinococcus arenicola TaxID=2994950 RepID=A0ABU4DLU4_9DEIO|nr:phospholipase D-like domain-containing protein [Deinococcus sp. ZS9-10]MDV6373405.1 phospholipase D-like domain-containing protein [Deinococcus sp. ZS9-10]